MLKRKAKEQKNLTARARLVEILNKPLHIHAKADKTEAVADFLLDNDVEPVLRCKYCRMYEENAEARTGLCRRELQNLFATPEGFCSYGERADT